MPKPPTNKVKTLGVQLKPDSPQRIREIERLTKELEPIIRVTASGNMTWFTLMLWNRTIAACRDRLQKFDGIDAAVESVADTFEAFLKQNVRPPR